MHAPPGQSASVAQLPTGRPPAAPPLPLTELPPPAPLALVAPLPFDVALVLPLVGKPPTPSDSCAGDTVPPQPAVTSTGTHQERAIHPPSERSERPMARGR